MPSAGESVEQVEVRVGIEQGLVLVLAVKVDEAGGQVAQRGGRREGAVDERAAAALRGDLAADEQFVARRLVLEDRLERGAVLARPDEVGRGAAAEEQADRLDEDRLAGAGFAGQDVEARAELDLDRFDDGQVSDGEEPEHATPPSAKGRQKPGNAIISYV